MMLDSLLDKRLALYLAGNATLPLLSIETELNPYMLKSI
jgi:hypothetical protein